MTHRNPAPLAYMVFKTAVAVLFAAVAIAAGAAFTGDAPVQEKTSTPSATELRTMTARFAPAEIGADVTRLPASERQALSASARGTAQGSPR